MGLRISRRITVGLALIALCMIFAPPASNAGKNLDGRWVLTLTIPEAPKSKIKQTFMLTLEASPRGKSLHGRATITDRFNRVFGGVWRQVGKKVSITFEMPCGPDEPCASLVLLGKIKPAKSVLKKGEVIVMWDTFNDNDPSLYDTSKGTFSGERIE